MITTVLELRSANVELTRALHHEATHDALVDLVNCREFHTRLQRVAAMNLPCCCPVVRAIERSKSPTISCRECRNWKCAGRVKPSMWERASAWRTPTPVNTIRQRSCVQQTQPATQQSVRAATGSRCITPSPSTNPAAASLWKTCAHRSARSSAPALATQGSAWKPNNRGARLPARILVHHSLE